MAGEEGAHGGGGALDLGTAPGERPGGPSRWLTGWQLGWTSGPWTAPAGSGTTDDADADTGRRSADHRAEQWTTWLLLAAAVVATVGAVLLAVRAWGMDWYPVGDYGSLRLRVLDVGTDHTPLLGVYSRWGWNHPGPLLLYLLAPWVRLAGGDGNGMLLGALLVNLSAIAATVWVAARAGRRSLALVGLVLALLVVGLDPAWLMDAWNPYALVVPLFAAAVATWRTAVGDRVAAVVLVVCASFTLQAHVLAGPPVALLLLVAVAGLGLRIWRGSERSHDLRTALLAAAVGVVLWIPPVIDQLTNSPGNLRQIVSFVLNGDETPVGWAFGARVVGRALSLPPLWVTGGVSTERTPIPWALFALVAATAWALRRRWSSETALCAVAWALVVAGFVGSSRVTGVAFPYLFEWLRVVAAVTWLAAATVLLSEVVRRWEPARWAAAGFAAVTVLVLLGQFVAGPDLTGLERSDRPLRDVYHVIDPTLEAVRDLPGPIVMTPTVYGIDTSVGIELLHRAEQEGIDLRFVPEMANVVGEHRTVDPADAAGELVLASGPARATYKADPRYRLVADVEPLSPEEWAEYDALSTVDWANQTPDGPDRGDPRFQRYRELSDRAFENLSIFLRVDGSSTG